MPELRAKFTADDSQLSSKINGIQGKLSGLKSVFGGLAAGFGVMQVVQFGKSVANVAGDLSDMSDSLGIATSDIQALQVFAVKAGLPLEKLEQVLNRIGASSIAAIADPAGDAAKKFAALGISVKDIASANEIQRVEMLGRKISELLNDPKAMDAASDIIGIKSRRAFGVIRDYGKAGSESAREMSKSFAMSEDAVAKLDETMDKLTLKKMQAKSYFGELMAGVLSPFKLNEQMKSELKEFLPQSMFRKQDGTKDKDASQDDAPKEKKTTKRDSLLDMFPRFDRFSSKDTPSESTESKGIISKLLQQRDRTKRESPLLGMFPRFDRMFSRESPESARDTKSEAAQNQERKEKKRIPMDASLFGALPRFDKLFFDEIGGQAADAGRMLSKNMSRVSDLTSNPVPQGKPDPMTGRNIQEAMERQLKTASSMNVSDPFAAVGRAAGRDVTSETLGALYKIVENTSRIQPTPAPVMR